MIVSDLLSTSAKKTLLDQIMSRLKKEENGCWIWNGYRVGRKDNNTAAIMVRGKMVNVRRLLHTILEKQPPLENYAVRSTCKIRDCANPDHLEKSTLLKGGRPSTV